jgi:hypothetical protein
MHVQRLGTGGGRGLLGSPHVGPPAIDGCQARRTERHLQNFPPLHLQLPPTGVTAHLIPFDESGDPTVNGATPWPWRNADGVAAPARPSPIHTAHPRLVKATGEGERLHRRRPGGMDAFDGYMLTIGAQIGGTSRRVF